MQSGCLVCGGTAVRPQSRKTLVSGPILIQGAMDVELELFLAGMENPRAGEVGGYLFWEGELCGRAAVLSRTEIGMVNCACATALGVTRYSPELVINQGLAGGHVDWLHVGDVVLGETAVNIHDFETQPRKRGEGCDPSTWSFGEHPEVHRGDPMWLVRLAHAPYGGGKLVLGRLGAGDVFTREADRILWLTGQRGHLCEDMESFAAYSVCSRFRVPCVGARILSNNELTGEPYQRTIAGKLQEFILRNL
ncbi:MAG: 5'-methylthioadenosine nucleosidase [Clostridia bacterium]|nr:5'-methylthioadenosine nucleosidase [Clostridia bacterium]